MAETVCRHNKFGFCKFGERCHKRHVDKCCENSECDVKLCENRLPRICKYFSIYKRCKYNEFCKYKHFDESLE